MSLPLPSARPRRPRAAFVAAAVAAVAVVLALMGLLLYHHPASRQASGQLQPSHQTRGRVPARAPGSIAVSTAGWHSADLDGTVVPESPQAGPQQGPWPLAGGYADTPAGAVLAAVNIALRTAGQLGPDIFTVTISRQVTGAGAAALLSAAWKDYAAAVGQHPPASTGGPAGAADASTRAFRLISWTAQAATVEVLAGADNGSGPGLVVTLQVQWLGGDWRLVAPANGIFAGTAAKGDVPDFTPLPGG
jgi:hypothetical protein